MSDDPILDLLNIAPLLKEVMELGVVDGDILAAVGAVACDPDDTDAWQFVDSRLQPKRALAQFFPDPFGNPFPEEVDGPYLLGTVPGTGARIGLSEGSLNRNVIIVGEAGSGKTTTLITLMISILEAS